MVSEKIEMQYVGDVYHNEVVGLVEGFRYEYCVDCGLDLIAHNIVPDPLGHPHTVCLYPLTD